MTVLHVGMGKTATTSLQQHVFRHLAAQGHVGSYNPRALVFGLDAAINGFTSEEGLADRAALEPQLLISSETLLEWDPLLWEASAERLLRVFGPDVTILITMRAPESYLRSLYQQVLHMGKIRRPEDFFLPTNTYRAARRFVRAGELDAIDVDAFDMVRMVSLYAERFSQVVLVPFEAIGEMHFLRAIWGLSEADCAALAGTFAAAPRANTSYSRLAVKLTLGRERLLASLGLRSLSASDGQLGHALAHARGQPLQHCRSWQWLPSWNRLMKLLSRYGPQAGYRLPQDLYLGRHLAANGAFYASTRSAPGGVIRICHGHPEGVTLAGFPEKPAPAVAAGN